MKSKLADKYFAYLAKHFPVMCASARFSFMPAVRTSADRLDRLEDFSQSSIRSRMAKIRKFKNLFEAEQAKADTVEDRAKAEILAQNASGILTEFEQAQTWRKAPELYLSVAFTGLAQCQDMPAETDSVRARRMAKRLVKIPGFLSRVARNVEAISHSSRAAAQTLVRDCARFLNTLESGPLSREGRIARLAQKGLVSLRDFDRFVATRPEVPEPEGPDFTTVMSGVLGSDKSAAEIFEIAETEWRIRLRELDRASRDFGRDWHSLLEDYTGMDGTAPLDEMVRTIHELRSFVMEYALPGIFRDADLHIHEPPLHLSSMPDPIQYEAGLLPDIPAKCFINVHAFSGRGFRDDQTMLARIRREHLFLAARYTYPGLHLLHSSRRASDDPVFSQTAHPLFVHGWLAFAEDMLGELDLLRAPQPRLVLVRRALRRAGTAMIDAGLATKALTQDQCLEILEQTGFSRHEGLELVRTIRLMPGNKVCPVLGLHELRQLRSESGLDLGEFCSRILQGGHVSFALAGHLVNRDKS
ncbi:DUF885 family protein [Pseudodesulfovibrio tunisiensis]|uniref:DUF885 family protein n=1 Tax=Pseudodesulfovibrio tunisiensis TaxID=463192 RepID=UPI001FB2DD86|nr:DUF885 family protein [Pseudodesulfovibrio tunisiensis]